jgi:hypothetical protein
MTDDVCEDCGREKTYPTRLCSCSTPSLAGMLTKGVIWYVQALGVWIRKGLMFGVSFLLVGAVMLILRLAFMHLFHM